MGWMTDALQALTQGKDITVRPRGGSMRGVIEDNQPVTLAPVSPLEVRAGDVVFVRWKGGALLHLVKDATPERVLIGNALGRINGWARRSDVLGRVARIHPRTSGP
ncbi:hypothetical protein SAMN05443572_107251 [Myxococcus fulvus]|uniref:Peptidase S24/S26A/S26B/S26C domain-containing protein n=1 Tax=Myxococcus fulvus TaxID=33 RepID=A0A511T8A9_MYXFU|nr:hypothetical protein [Myxococcus fulvus]GEN09843.1 hypothetical protein MFU01_48800 [Myxococcus fulvus]SEU26396.1 hypothetical protein SAMN05443572_107251 [Myxococcus fulvus]